MMIIKTAPIIVTLNNKNIAALLCKVTECTGMLVSEVSRNQIETGSCYVHITM